MSPIRSGRANVARPSSEDLLARAEALGDALETGGAQLDAAHAGRARAVIERVRERTTLSDDHTVVALAGATGSGKSSLFNALVGAEVAVTGVRRPTTAAPTAAVWGERDAGKLLDWLKVGTRHIVPPAGEEQVIGSLDGLVLLDLPDFDSREESHRREAERILELVDVFVWVTDPQKYADARLHDDFVRTLSQHESVTLAVMNQADRMPTAEAAECAADLGRLLRRDGLADAPVLLTSARTGAGVPELRQRIANVVAGRAAARQRLGADVITTARVLRSNVADGETRVDRLPRSELDGSLARTAGVPVVLDAVGRDYRREALARTGWLFTRWAGRRGPSPLRRLRLDDAPTLSDVAGGGDGSTAVTRSSLPPPSSAARSAVEVAIRGFARSAAEGLPVQWTLAVEDAAAGDDRGLPDALDQAVLGTSLATRRPAWWGVLNTLQWLFGLVAVGGALWLLALYALGLLAIPAPEPPAVGVVPVPLLMIVVGLVLGILSAALARWLARIGARRRKAIVAKRLRASIAEVTGARIVAPIAEVLERHRTTREHLERAGR